MGKVREGEAAQALHALVLGEALHVHARTAARRLEQQNMQQNDDAR